MTRTRLRGSLALLALTAVAGYVAVLAAPDGAEAIGIWPAGLATAALILAPRRHRLWLVGAIAVVAAVGLALGGIPWTVGVPFGVLLGLGSALTQGVITLGTTTRPSLHSDGDLRRFLMGVGAGATLLAAGAALVAYAADWGWPGRVAISSLTAFLASQVALLPFFCRLPDHDAIASKGERWLQWSLLVLTAPLIFWPADFPSLVFLLVPLLVWSALRVTAMEALGQQALVFVFAILLTSIGRGPFAGLPDRFGLPTDASLIALAMFIASTGLIVVPLVLRVGEQVETARRASSEADRLRTIVEKTPGVAIIGTDAELRITIFNPGAERLLGYSAEEALGQPATMMLPPGVPEILVANGEETELRRKDGTRRMVSLYVSPIIDDRGRLLGFVSTSEDITEHLLTQKALEEALATERAAVERLQEIDQVKDAFVSSVSHELRTPITSILGYLEMLNDGVFGRMSPQQRDALDRVVANSDRLLRLIDELLTLSRIQDGQLQLVSQRFDLCEAVRSAYGVVAISREQSVLDSALVLPDRPVLMDGDRDMVERVVVNLVGNAFKFTEDGGHVRVRLDVDDADAVIVVSDTGMGIPDGERERLFTRFFRSSLAQERAIPGSGLGLSITHAIVERHGGSIDVRSRVGEGSAFTVRLPLAG